MKIVTIDGHSFDESRFRESPVVLDAGCRDFQFCRGMEARGCIVVTLDADKSIKPNISSALVGEGKPPSCWYIAAQEAGRVVFEPNPSLEEVPTITIERVVSALGWLDLVKMDIEGSEYDVLLTWPGPVAGQISVEFHEPTGQGTAKHGADIYDRILRHLGQWYDLVKHDSLPYPGGVNYYDSLFVLKEPT